MSASDKKKLRKEQQNEMLTARQRQEQAEAKKLKIYTATFIGIMLAIVVAVISILSYKAITNSGIIEKNTIAATVNDQEINSVVMTYYYQDAIGKMYEDAYTNFSSYFELYFESVGLDLHTPLNQQNNPSTGKPWSDYFVDRALEQAKYDFTFAALAEKDGFALTEDDQANLATQMSNLEANAKLSGYTNANNYLKALYGPGSDVESYKTYLTRGTLANAYCTHYYDDVITVEPTEIEEHNKENADKYNSYDFSYVYLSYSSFLEKTDDATATPTEEEKNAARAEAKKMADELYALGNLDAIRDKVNEIENNEVVIVDEVAKRHTAVNTTKMAEWLAAAEREPGEVGLLENSSTNEETNETTINGYYVICFTKKIDNTTKMSNVRHLLVAFEGGTEDEVSGEMVYTQAEKDAAHAKAKELLQKWRDGEATENSFAALVTKETDDTGSAETGGLFENIHVGSNYVPNFLSWAIDPAREAGNIDIVETEYGYHIMYFTGYSELSYRDQLITDEIKADKYETWHNTTMETASAAAKNLSKIGLDEAIAG